MEIKVWKALSPEEQEAVLTRPAQGDSARVEGIVRDIIAAIRKDGDSALKNYVQTLDRYDGALELTGEEIQTACERLDPALKEAIDRAYANLYAFHKAQEPCHARVETVPGIICECASHPIDAVGLYVPGGSAPLVSTALMLSVPAQIAGCPEVILCSPPPVSDAIIYAATLGGVKRIFAMGGAHAIAAMAYGTESVPKVLKIFGPGNQYVTMAKRLVADDPRGAAIDMPAGPSEVLVIADKHACPQHIAADLLSQAEHGPDSQVILLSDDREVIEKSLVFVGEYLKTLPRAEIARKALSRSTALLCEDMDTCVTISNRYAPEHLIVEVENPRSLVPVLRNAGSIFLGAYTSESLGDYAQGTNHTLPTYGYAHTASALGTDDYRRRYTISEATPDGFLRIAPVVKVLADAEGLGAHKLAVTVREKTLTGK